MSTAHQIQAREIIDQVRDWPVAARQELARDILLTLPPATGRVPGKSLRNLLGLMKTGDRPPGDAECQAILEDELTRKHVR